jgi:hypothetical protein
MKHRFEFGGIWEYRHFEIWADVVVETDYETTPCKHCHSHGLPKFICPRVVVSYNEGGSNSTGVCLDCIVEAAQAIDELENQNSNNG